MKKLLLSVVLATFNEEENIHSCLSSVSALADEIIVVDGSSTDSTAQIARKYTSRVYISKNYPIFHINKQKGIDYAKGEWILQIDADEKITNALKDEIQKIIKDTKSCNGYWIARKNYFCGKWMKKGGMYPDYVVRLFKKNKGHLPCKSVHEQIEIDGSVGYLKNPMIHVPYRTFNDYKKKADTYTTLTAKEYKAKNVPITLASSFKYVVWLPFKTFFTLYIRHRGVLDGKWGFVWAWNSALHHAQAYSKYKKL